MAKKAEGKVTQKEAVKQAIAAGKDTPAEGVVYVKDQFGMELSNQAFSILKSQLKSKSSAGTARRGRPPASAAHSPANGSMASSIAAIKKLVDQLGVDDVKAIAEVFRK